MRPLAFLALALVLAVHDLPAGAAGFDGFQIFDGRIGEPGDYPAMAGTDGFRRRVQPPATLIERRPNSLVADMNRALIDHG